MALPQITYTDKIGGSNTPAEQYVNNVDMNEIKTVTNGAIDAIENDVVPIAGNSGNPMTGHLYGSDPYLIQKFKGVKLGQNTSNQSNYVDFLSSTDPSQLDHSARLVRNSGVNGALIVTNLGGGNISIASGADIFLTANGGRVGINTSRLVNMGDPLDDTDGVNLQTLEGITASTEVKIGSSAGATSQGANSVSVGNLAGQTNQGSNSVAVGVQAGENSTGDFNAFIGRLAGQNSTGVTNSALGNRAGENLTSEVNTSNIGNASQVTASNQVQLGNSATTTYAYGAVQDRSDLRDKADVQDVHLGLEFLEALTPRSYKFDYREDYREHTTELQDVVTGQDEDGNDITEEQEVFVTDTRKLGEIEHDGTHVRSRLHCGLVAQEVKQVMDDLGVDFAGYQDHGIAGGDDVLSIGYGELISPMIKAIQELSARVKELESA